MPDKENHNELAQKAKTDESAFTELYNIYIDQIFGFVKRRVNHTETAEDLVSDVFRKVFLNLNRFDPDKAAFRTWIYSITSNTLVDYYRSSKNPVKSETIDIEEIFDLRSKEQTPHELALSVEQKEFVQGCVSNLPKKYQKIVQLKYFAEYSNEEIAEVMDLSVNNVRVILHRALKKLKPLIIQ